METGIVGYGSYVPSFKVMTSEMGDFWKNKNSIIKHLGVVSKSLCSPLEDSATMSAEASNRALNQAEIDREDIQAIFVGSESHPYTVKPTGTILKSFLGIQNEEIFCSDLEFACKAGTTSFQIVDSFIRSGRIAHGISCGVDDSQSSPSDILDVTSGSGAASFVQGSSDLIAKLNYHCSITRDVPDFWRKEGEKYPTHGGRFTGKPAYFKTIERCSKSLMDQAKTSVSDYDHVIFHGPNGFFPLASAKRLNFDSKQLTSLPLIQTIGNTYSGNSLLSLAWVLDEAKPGDRIFLCSYGSGAGSDAFDFEITDNILNIDRSRFSLKKQLSRQISVSYDKSLLFKHQISFK